MGLEDGEGFSSSPEDLEDPRTDLEGCHARCTIRSARWDQDFNVNSAVGNTSIPTPVLTPGNMGSLGPIAMEATVLPTLLPPLYQCFPFLKGRVIYQCCCPMINVPLQLKS